MIRVPLDTLPNQTLQFNADGVRYDITLREVAPGVMSADVSVNLVPIVTGNRCAAGAALIPYGYLEIGNFIFVTEDDALPYWTEFGSSQSLFYVSQQEVADARP